METRQTNPNEEPLESVQAAIYHRMWTYIIKALRGFWHQYYVDEHNHFASGFLRKNEDEAYLSRLSYGMESVLLEVKIGQLTECTDVFALRSLLQQHHLPAGTRLCQDPESGEITLQSSASVFDPKSIGNVAKGVAQNLAMALTQENERLLSLGITPAYRAAQPTRV